MQGRPPLTVKYRRSQRQLIEEVGAKYGITDDIKEWFGATLARHAAQVGPRSPWDHSLTLSQALRSIGDDLADTTLARISRLEARTSFGDVMGELVARLESFRPPREVRFATRLFRPFGVSTKKAPGVRVSVVYEVDLPEHRIVIRYLLEPRS